MPASRIGPYEVLSLLGRGGMAEVYRARYRGAAGAEREVVVKQLLPLGDDQRPLTEMFIAEARLTLKLSHGNLVQVFDFGEDNGRYYLAMELVDGVSLADVLDATRKKGLPGVPAPVAVAMVLGVCRGLHYAHTRKNEKGQPLRIVHRDVSPDNVLVGWDGQVKVADFGIARAELAGRGKTEPGIFKGKFAYSAPEQARAEAVDARADVYSTALVLYELLTGANPQSAQAMRIAAGVERVPLFPRELADDELARLIDAALDPEPDGRPASAQVLEERLSAWLAARRCPTGDQVAREYLAQLFTSREGVATRPDAPVQPQPLLGTGDAAPAIAAVTTAAHRNAIKATAPRGPGALVYAGVAGLFVAVAGVTGLALSDWGDDAAALEPRPLEALSPAPKPSPVAARAPAPAVPAPNPTPAAAPVVREAIGVPALARLSSKHHALDLTAIGLGLERKGAPAWRVATVPSLHKSFPPYAALFFADLAADGQLLALGMVNRDGHAFQGAAARLFLAQPAHRPEEGSFDAVVKRDGQADQRLAQVYIDAITPITERAFTIESLAPRRAYYVLLHRNAEGPTPPVLMLRARPTAVLVKERLNQPLDQQLLTPGVSLQLSQVSRLSFVILRTPGEPEREATVEVNGQGSLPLIIRGKGNGAFENTSVTPAIQPARGGGPLGDDRTADYWLDIGTVQMSRKNYAEAIRSFDRCLRIDPDRVSCEAMKERAEQQLH